MGSPSTLLDEALSLSPFSNRVILIEDCVETSGAFILHHLMKRALSLPPETNGSVLFVAFAQPFPHYDRIMRKLGYNLSIQRQNKKVHFFDMLKRVADKDGLVGLFAEIRSAALEVISSGDNRRGCTTIMIDDISLLEIAAHGSEQQVLDFLHYCVALTSELGCSLVLLNHEDIYSNGEAPKLLANLEYLADIVIKAEPLATGLAADVHGQLTVIRKPLLDGQSYSASKISNFHFKVKENGVEYFYPGSRH